MHFFSLFYWLNRYAEFEQQHFNCDSDHRPNKAKDTVETRGRRNERPY